jgi:receptor protein-tyrosine kinase
LRHFASDHLLRHLDVESNRGSGVLAITVTDEDPVFATRVANAFATHYVDLATALRGEPRTAATDPRPIADPPRTSRRAGADPTPERGAPVVLDVAREPSLPAGPRPVEIVMAGVLVGLLGAILAAASAEWRDRRIRGPADLKRASGWPTLAVLHHAFPGRRLPEPPVASAVAGEGWADTRTLVPGRVADGAPLLDPTVGTTPRVGDDEVRHPPSATVDALDTGAGAPSPTDAAPTPIVPPPDSYDGILPAGPDASGPVRQDPPSGELRSELDAPVPEAVTAEAVTADAIAAEPAGVGHGDPTGPRGPGGASPVATGRPSASGRLQPRPLDEGSDAARRQPLGQILVQAGLMQPPEVERVLSWARQEGLRFGEAAVASRLVSADQVERALAYQFSFSILERGASAVSEEVVAAYDPRNPTVTDLRRVRTALRVAQGDASKEAPLKSVAIVSPAPGEGKSFVAANLAVTCAQTGQRTLLIDADLRRGRLHTVFGLSNTSGLSSMLNGRIQPGCIQRIDGLRQLTVLTRGPDAPNPSELLSRDALTTLHQAFARGFDIVIYDTPGAADEPDTVLIARTADAVIGVARRHSSRFDAVTELAASDAMRGRRVVGMVLNDA